MVETEKTMSTTRWFENGARTKGGEALAGAAVMETATIDRQIAESWYVLWTHSNSEQLVHTQLATKGFQLFLPTIEAWSRRGGVRRLTRVPMFSGYVFLRHAMDKTSYIEICKARGLVRVLGERWDQLDVMPDADVDAIRKVVGTRLPIFPYPYLRDGQRVRITGGPLVDVEGILVRGQPNKGLLVISVDLLRRSIAVQIDCTLVEGA